MTEPFPAQLASVSPWPASSWAAAHQILGERADWPQLAKAIIDLQLEPATAARMLDGVSEDEQAVRLLTAISKTLWGRFFALGTALRRLGQDLKRDASKLLPGRR